MAIKYLHRNAANMEKRRSEPRGPSFFSLLPGADEQPEAHGEKEKRADIASGDARNENGGTQESEYEGRSQAHGGGKKALRETVDGPDRDRAHCAAASSRTPTIPANAVGPRRQNRPQVPAETEIQGMVDGRLEKCPARNIRP